MLFFFWKKALTNLDSILKTRHYFAEKGPYSKAIVFPVLKYGCECWTITMAEHQGTHVFKLW